VSLSADNPKITCKSVANETTSTVDDEMMMPNFNVKQLVLLGIHRLFCLSIGQKAQYIQPNRSLSNATEQTKLL